MGEPGLLQLPRSIGSHPAEDPEKQGFRPLQLCLFWRTEVSKQAITRALYQGLGLRRLEGPRRWFGVRGFGGAQQCGGVGGAESSGFDFLGRMLSGIRELLLLGFWSFGERQGESSPWLQLKRRDSSYKYTVRGPHGRVVLVSGWTSPGPLLAPYKARNRSSACTAAKLQSL